MRACILRTRISANQKNAILPTIMFIIFWEFLMVEQIFLSPQVKHTNFASTCQILENRNWNLSVVRHFTWQLEGAPNILRMTEDTTKYAYKITNTPNQSKLSRNNVDGLFVMKQDEVFVLTKNFPEVSKDSSKMSRF